MDGSDEDNVDFFWASGIRDFDGAHKISWGGVACEAMDGGDEGRG